MSGDLHKHLQNKGREYLLNQQYWVRAVEMPTSIGIVDVWGISNANKFDTACIEVKVSRNDYRSKSQKYKELRADCLANYCYLLCPEGLIKEHESPNWGIIWYYANSDRLRIVREPRKIEMSDTEKLHIMVHLFENRANRPDNLLEEQEKLMLEKFGHIYMESKHFQAVREVSFADITVDIKAFLRKSMKIAYMRGAESFTKYVNENRPHSWACTEDCCVCEGGVFMRDLEKLFLPDFKQQLQSPEPEGEKERGV